jgi:hypothetical protein
MTSSGFQPAKGCVCARTAMNTLKKRKTTVPARNRITIPPLYRLSSPGSDNIKMKLKEIEGEGVDLPEYCTEPSELNGKLSEDCQGVLLPVAAAVVLWDILRCCQQLYYVVLNGRMNWKGSRRKRT